MNSFRIIFSIARRCNPRVQEKGFIIAKTYQINKREIINVLCLQPFGLAPKMGRLHSATRSSIAYYIRELKAQSTLESASFSFRIRIPFTRIRRIRQRIRIFLNQLSRVEKNKSATNPITCGGVNPDNSESDDVANPCLVSYRTINLAAQQQQQGKFAATIARFMAHALNTFYCRGLQRTPGNNNESARGQANSILNALRVDGKIFESV